MNRKIVMVMYLALLTAGWFVENIHAETETGSSKHTGHPVKIVSLCFQQGESLEKIVNVMDREGKEGVDLVCLPEAWRGQDKPETLDGETITAMKELAQRHRCFIVCPIDRKEGEYRFNSSVLIDREGNVVCIYDKVFPYWSEFDIQPPVDPSQRDVEVYETDFGNVGLAICYDAKFPEVWQRLRDKGAELVVWSSAYSGGTELQAFSLLHHYYIITSTWTGDCLVFDMTGECLLDERSENAITVARFILDMDRTIYHYNFNLDKRKRLLEKHSDDIIIDKDLPREEWFVLKAIRPGVSVRKLGREFGLEELRDYKDRSRVQIDEKRGFGFSERYGGYPGSAK